MKSKKSWNINKRTSKADSTRPPSIALVILIGSIFWFLAGMVAFDMAHYGNVQKDKWIKSMAIKNAQPEEIDNVKNECKLRSFVGLAYMLTGLFVLWKTHMGVLICCPKPNKRIELFPDIFKTIIKISTIVLVLYAVIFSGLMGVVCSYFVRGMAGSIGPLIDSGWSITKTSTLLAIMASTLTIPFWWLWAALHILKDRTIQNQHGNVLIPNRNIPYINKDMAKFFPKKFPKSNQHRRT